MGVVVFGGRKIDLEQIANIAIKRYRVKLSNSKSFTELIQKGVDILDQVLERDGQIYGVTTGFGNSCNVQVDKRDIEKLPTQLVHFHNCGMGEYFSEIEARSIQATRLAALCNGMSGVSYDLLEKILVHLNAGISPCIPKEGSVGASGDLTPLSYFAAALIGEQSVYHLGSTYSTMDILKKLDISPYQLRPKEGLALMNGTAVMTGLACLAYRRAEYLSQISTRITSLMCVVLKGNHFHFDEALFKAKPYKGQMNVARRIREDLQSEQTAPSNPKNLQDRYSIRCAPHVIGVLEDALPFFKKIIEIELNSTNDNPIIDIESCRILHGGHFYGGHIAFVMDSMKSAIANIADLIDRQVALLMDSKFNNGLPANLSFVQGSSAAINHGLKAVQIGVSAWTAESLKLTMPASVFSRSTECHNQDKVSMGTISARDCLRILQLTEQVASAAILSVAQAFEIRRRSGDLKGSQMSRTQMEFLESVFSEFEFIDCDRPLEKDLRKFTENIQNQKWNIY